MKPQVQKDHYFNTRYISKRRMISYSDQLENIMNQSPENVLEIGIGPGVVRYFLNKFDVDITTVDIDKELDPDCVVSICDLPFKYNSFDVVAAFEVLEHIPFEHFNTALGELHRVTRDKCILSLPDAEKNIPFVFPVYDPQYKIRLYRKLLPIPIMRKEHVFDGEHYWEINKRGYELDKIKNAISNHFNIIETYKTFSNPYHRFFVLECCK